MKSKIVIGTRGSELALWQANQVQIELEQNFSADKVEKKIIQTTGDRLSLMPLKQAQSQIENFDKGAFCKELELALLTGEIDLAVHSMKDVPAELNEAFELVAVLPRGSIADVLVSKHEGGIDALPEMAQIGTSSIRRQCQWEQWNPQVKIVPIRGNVGTRLSALEQQEGLDGIVLAQAGLERLGLYNTTLSWGKSSFFVTPLDVETFVPAASQGAIAIEMIIDQIKLKEKLKSLNDQKTMMAVSAERKLLQLMGATCQTPIGVLSEVRGDQLRLKVQYFTGGLMMVNEVIGSFTQPEKIGQDLFQLMRISK